MRIVLPMQRLSLRRARTKAKLTQEQLAEKSGVDQSTISHIECGRRPNPSFDTAMRLAQALGIAPSRLRFSEPEPDEPKVNGRGDKAGQSPSGAAA